MPKKKPLDSQPVDPNRILRAVQPVSNHSESTAATTDAKGSHDVKPIEKEDGRDTDDVGGDRPHVLTVSQRIAEAIARSRLDLFISSNKSSHSLKLRSAFSDYRTLYADQTQNVGGSTAGVASSDGMRSVTLDGPFVFEEDNAYGVGRHEPLFTNLTATFRDCLDYIFYSGLRRLRVDRLPTLKEAMQEVALPNSKWPSDHLALSSSFTFA